jgi:hypothetical protein
MSSIPINQGSDITAPTPQNTPLTQAPISATFSRPTVPDISEDAEPAEESANVHDAVFGLVQGRLAGLLGKSSGYIESLPDGAKKTLEALKGVQVKQNELQNQYKRECLELEKKVSHPIPVPFFWPFYVRPCPLPLLPLLSEQHPHSCPALRVGSVCSFSPAQSPSIRNRDMIDVNKWAFLDPLPIQNALP